MVQYICQSVNWEEEETDINQTKNPIEQFIFYFFNIVNIFLLSDDRDIIRWQQINHMNNTWQITQIYTHVQGKNYIQAMRTLTRSIWADPLSNKDRTPQSHYTSCQILQQSLCHQRFYSTCQASHATSFDSPDLRLGFARCLWITRCIKYMATQHRNIHMMSNLTIFRSYFFP